MNIPYLNLSYQNDKIKKQVQEGISGILERDWYVLGKESAEFEKVYATFNEVNHVIGTGNGLDALRVSLYALGVGNGDEVIVPANTFIATWLAVSSVGATIIPVEPDPVTYNISPKAIREAITKKTKAIMPVHLYGQACEMDAICAIAEEFNLHIVEDNAQSQGATFKGKLTGTFGVLNGTSFYPGKNIGAFGDAGAITSNDEEFASKARKIANYGSAKKYLHEYKGINSRLDEFQAVVLKEKLKFIDAWNTERKAIAKTYIENLQDCSGITLPYTHKDATHVYHIFMIQCEQRDALQKHLASKGIGTLVHYPIPPHLQEAYKELQYQEGDFPITEKICRNALSLPLFPGLSTAEIQYICQEVKRFFA